MNAWFVTGTDTGVGKTVVATALLHRLRERYERVVGMKPVAAGAQLSRAGTWDQEDVDALREASSIDAPRELVNPYMLAAPVSPHIAARQEGVSIEPSRVVAAFRMLRQQADAVVVEGAGGFRVPLDNDLDGADLAVALGLPVVLVVGLRLGCLNHALLSHEAIEARGLSLAGWVANRVDVRMAEVDANIALLARRLPAPCLGDLPYRSPPDPRAVAAYLHLPDSFFQ